VPWRFLDAGQLSVRSLFVAGVQKPSQISGLLRRRRGRIHARKGRYFWV
jgi:hypothetical protein